MSFYWKMVAGCSLAMMLGGAVLQWFVWGTFGMAATLIAGYAGVKVAPYVPMLRSKHTMYAVSIIVVGGLLQGLGLVLQIGLIWAVGLVATLALPLAGLFFDCEKDAMRRREMLKDCINP